MFWWVLTLLKWVQQIKKEHIGRWLRPPSDNAAAVTFAQNLIIPSPE